MKTDFLRLSEHKIFKEACENLPKNVNIPLNLVTVQDSILFTWDFQNNCVLSLNIKAARSKEGDNVIHQKLIPLHPPLFSPTFLFGNESGNLLAVAGPNGILVLDLPHRSPPYGAFHTNTEVVYCRSYSLDERLLACSDVIEVRQAKFHPGSISNSHILALTSDNQLRLYVIENKEAINLAIYSVGEKPGGMFPGSKTAFLDIYGEIAVDFDFGFPEISDAQPALDYNKSIALFEYDEYEDDWRRGDKIKPMFPKKLDTKKKKPALVWPVYILRGDSGIYSMHIDLNKRSPTTLLGPYQISGQSDFMETEACALICLKTTPQIFSVATSKGTVTNLMLLDIDEDAQEKIKNKAKSLVNVPTKELIVFETIELELGLNTYHESEEEAKKYKCPIFLHKDDSKVSRFFATHNAGVHSINLSCFEELHNFVFGPEDANPTSDIFINPSTAEYLICTRAAHNDKANPVTGFAIYYEPTSIITLLNDGSVVTLDIISAPLPPKTDILSSEAEKDGTAVQSPLKKMLNEPFDQYIQKILKKASSQPVFKLSSTSNNTPEECYELLQSSGQVFREQHFNHFTKVREELEKRMHTLNMLKQSQMAELERMKACKDQLREKAENLAEKYEDLKDKQDEFLKRTEQLLMMVSRKKLEPSEAERNFMKQLHEHSGKCAKYDDYMDKLKKKLKYQQVQIENWKSQESKKIQNISEIQSTTIKNALEESSKKINGMITEVNQYKKQFNIK